MIASKKKKKIERNVKIIERIQILEEKKSNN